MKKLKTRKEKVQKDNIALRWIFKVSEGCRGYVCAYALLSSAMAFFGVMTTYGTKGVINGANTGDVDLLKRSAVYLLILLLLQVILKLTGRNLYERARAKIEIKIKTCVFETILQKDYASISRYHSGEVLNRLTSDVIIVTDGVINLVPNVFSLLTRLIMAMAIMITLDPLFAVIFAAAGVALMASSKLFRSYLKQIHKKAQETDGKVRSFFQEAVSEILVIKVFNAYEQVKAKARALMKDNYDVRMKRATVSIFANSGIQFAFSFGYLFAMVWGGFRVYQGIIDIGELTAILQLVNQIQSPIASLSSVLPTYYSVIASAERLMDFEKLPDEFDSQNDIENVVDFYKNFEGISIDDVSFKYDRDSVLENASAFIKKGDFVAVTGISGIGKSTLFKMILGVIYPDSGKIIIKSKNEDRLADRATRSLFAYVPQGNLLLSGTIYENICFMAEGKSDNDIKRAIELSCADEFVYDLPQGLNTVIGERGLGLSEGQVQRLAIARAILFDSPILLLDEATSALDEKTEERLLRNLKKLNGKTLIIITHKKAALGVCEKELIIEDKKITLKNTEGNL